MRSRRRRRGPLRSGFSSSGSLIEASASSSSGGGLHQHHFELVCPAGHAHVLHRADARRQVEIGVDQVGPGEAAVEADDLVALLLQELAHGAAADHARQGGAAGILRVGVDRVDGLQVVHVGGGREESCVWA